MVKTLLVDRMHNLSPVAIQEQSNGLSRKSGVYGSPHYERHLTQVLKGNE